jgi:ubiquinone/menaquinone biosynthesis C-methylase UbiE
MTLEQQSPVARLFDQIADEYDAVGVEFFKPIAAGLVGQLAPRPGERALDIGCGRGAALVPLAEAVGETGSVTGIDVSARMVEMATAELARHGLRADVRGGDAMDPELPAESFDLVASSLVLFFLPDPLVALKAWRGLLVDGGRVGVSTFGGYDDRWRQEVDAALARHAPPEVADARTTGARGPFGSDEGMEDLLGRAGFRHVHTVNTVVKARFDDPEHWYRWSMSVGQRQFWLAIPEHQLPEVKAEVLAAVDRCRDGSGIVGFDQTVRYTLGVR